MSVSLVPSHARWSFPAGATSLNQFQFCAVNTSGQLITPASTGVFAVVLDDAPSQGASGYTIGVQYGAVLPVGCVMKVIANATLNPGVPVQTDTNGKAVAAVTGGVILGYTLASCVAGDIVAIMLEISKA